MAKTLDEALDILTLLRVQLMHARRFQPPTLQTFRAACVAAEGDIEEFLNQHYETDEDT